VSRARKLCEGTGLRGFAGRALSASAFSELVQRAGQCCSAAARGLAALRALPTFAHAQLLQVRHRHALQVFYGR
jgi:hypothetical protein